MVIEEASGTIVMGANVRVSTVAIAQGNLTIRITETPQVSQPNPLSSGKTAVVPRTGSQVDDQPDRRVGVARGGVTLQDLVRGAERARRRPARPDLHPAGDQGRRRAAGRNGVALMDGPQRPIWASPGCAALNGTRLRPAAPRYAAGRNGAPLMDGPRPLTAAERAAAPPKLRQAAQAFEAQAFAQLLQPVFATADPSRGRFGGGAAEAQWRPMLVDAVAEAGGRAPAMASAWPTPCCGNCCDGQAAPQTEEPSR